MDDSAAMVIEKLIDAAAEEDTECIVMNLSARCQHPQLFQRLGALPATRFVDSLDDGETREEPPGRQRPLDGIIALDVPLTACRGLHRIGQALSERTRDHRRRNHG